MLQLPKFVLFTKCKLSRLVTKKSSLFRFRTLECFRFFNAGIVVFIFTKIQFFEARRFLLNSFYLAWQPLSSSCFGFPIRQSSHQDDASNKTENLNQYFKFDVPLLPSRALNLATFVFANFSFKLAGSYGVSPWLLKGRRSRLLVCIPSLPRSHLKIAYSAMLH